MLFRAIGTEWKGGDWAQHCVNTTVLCGVAIDTREPLPATHPEHWVEPSDTRELYLHTQSTGWNLVTPGNSTYTPRAPGGT